MPRGFHDLEIWKEARRLVLSVYRITRGFPREERYGLADQLQRSSVSIAANIAESTGRYHAGDKVQLLMVTRGSVEETRSHLAIVADLEYMEKEDYQDIDSDYARLARRINAFIGAVRKQTNQPSTNRPAD